tara:strand:+ start:7892 stop:8344 length:453 start_codon:yes stop_codon:yes gene_type:complete
MKINPVHERGIRLWLLTEVGRLCKMIDANKTLSTDEELQMCCRAIINDFPALKIEEVRTCFDMIIQGKFGKLYERLKTAEILECLRQYEGEVRAPILERHMHNQKHKELEWSQQHEKTFKKIVDSLDIKTIQNKSDKGLGSRLKKTLGTD